MTKHLHDCAAGRWPAWREDRRNPLIVQRDVERYTQWSTIADLAAFEVRTVKDGVARCRQGRITIEMICIEGKR